MDFEEIKSRINPQYQDVRGTESYERKWLCDEIERLRSLLQNGSPVVEGTIQHMAMEIAALKKELAAAHAETDSVAYARDRAYEQLAAMKEAK